jgi:hypothetical protein
VVLVLCVGGGIAIWVTVKDDVGEVVEATKTRVVAPETLNGRAKATDPGLVTASETMAAEVKKSVPEATSTVGAFYGDPAKDLVMIVGVSGLIVDPKQELDDAVREIGTELGVTTMTDVDSGTLGGNAKCGDGTTEGQKVSVCLWADRGSLGMVVFYYESGKDAEAEFATIRSAIVQRD